MKGHPSDPQYAAKSRAPSPFFAYYVFEALKSHGRKREVIDCIRRWWGVFLNWGLSTTPEDWAHTEGRLSACHAWSAHPVVHFHNILLGIAQNGLNWSKIDFAPVFVGKKCRGRVATPRGTVDVSWARSGDFANVRLVLPKDMRARVRLPGVRETVGGGRHAWRVKAGEG